VQPDTLDLERAEAPRGLHRGDRRQASLLLVKRDQLAQIQVAQAIAIGEADHLLVADVLGANPGRDVWSQTPVGDVLAG